jgi:short-subunit dehydrogenase
MSRPLAVITGASAGIGAEFARQLAARGYDLCLIARRRDALERLATELQVKHGIAAEAITADLTRDDEVAAVCARLSAATRLDLLVNNAGFGSHGLFFETDPARQDDMYRLHVLATERLTRAALPGMVERRRGSVINVASVAAFLPAPNNVSYCSTKTWMVAFTEGLSLELRATGSPVRVQALCPGFTYSEFHDVLKEDRSKIMSPGWWMTAHFVVYESLRAAERGELIVIPGLRYRMVVALTRLLPRRLLLAAVGRIRPQKAGR